MFRLAVLRVADVPHVLESLLGLIVRRGSRVDHLQTALEGGVEKRALLSARHCGVARNRLWTELTIAGYNLVRLAKLTAAAA